ncbi:hypothetical protein [Streptomyces sp. SPB074]|uniref:hypothetical protein n=1 Tax=Streptomyces sp. (strain SPB074) TaxID=465543 RepID=UPI00017F1067|nr:hypothetical protein [Streptomyces sp. SPB074]
MASDAETPEGAGPRGANGRFIRTPEGAARDARAARLRAQGRSFQQIADELGLKSKSCAHEAVGRALHSIVADDAEALRQREAARLDALTEEALAVLERTHYAHSHGRLVLGEDGKPLLDDGPKLAALRELRAIRESYRRLHGLDSPAKVEMGGELRYEVVGIDPADLV